MRHHLKKIREQIIVITGASSGIGLTTARLAARQGAKLALNARDATALGQLQQELQAAGAQVLVVPGDVGNESDVQHLADETIRQFGGFDTWVNNAGVSIYGRLEEVPLADQRRLFETNFWGLVHGSLIAVRHLKARFREGTPYFGALINIGSILSERAIPLQGIYSASKHAVKGFTDALRMELEKEGAPVSVTLVKPSAIDTPYVTHAKNYLADAPIHPPPVYAPDVVARAILHAAEHPQRDIVVGGAGRAVVAFGRQAPRLTDKAMEATMFGGQHSGKRSGEGRRPAAARHDNALYEPSPDGPKLQERGGYPGHVARTSAYTAAAQHPLTTLGLLAAAGLLLALMTEGAGAAAARRRRAAPEESYTDFP